MWETAVPITNFLVNIYKKASLSNKENLTKLFKLSTTNTINIITIYPILFLLD